MALDIDRLRERGEDVVDAAELVQHLAGEIPVGLVRPDRPLGVHAHLAGQYGYAVRVEDERPAVERPGPERGFEADPLVLGRQARAADGDGDVPLRQADG